MENTKTRKIEDIELGLEEFLDENNLVYPKIRKKNEIKIDGNIAFIYINGEKYNGKYFIIDKKYLPIISKFVWHYKDGYAVAILNGLKNYSIRMHRLIMNVLNSKHIVIDHINGNKNDNRECNLRICIKGQDADNQENINLHFEFPMIVDEFKMSDSLYILEVSNGLFHKVQIPYSNYKDVIHDKKYLYENNLDDGLATIMESKYNEFISNPSNYSDTWTNMIEQFDKKFEEASIKAQTEDCISMLNQFGIKEEDITLDKPYILPNGYIITIPSDKSCKEKYKNGETYLRIENDIYRESSFVPIKG